MRLTIFGLVAAVLLVWASPAFAAPTCQDENGRTLKCGTLGAMPVGWTPAVDQRWVGSVPGPMEPTALQLFYLACVIGGIFGVIAMMPDFEGRRDGGWDKQEGDDDD